MLSDGMKSKEDERDSMKSCKKKRTVSVPAIINFINGICTLNIGSKDIPPYITPKMLAHRSSASGVQVSLSCICCKFLEAIDDLTVPLVCGMMKELHITSPLTYHLPLDKI